MSACAVSCTAAEAHGHRTDAGRDGCPGRPTFLWAPGPGGVVPWGTSGTSPGVFTQKLRQHHSRWRRSSSESGLGCKSEGILPPGRQPQRLPMGAPAEGAPNQPLPGVLPTRVPSDTPSFWAVLSAPSTTECRGQRGRNRLSRSCQEQCLYVAGTCLCKEWSGFSLTCRKECLETGPQAADLQGVD